jgi:hypothetical protein
MEHSRLVINKITEEQIKKSIRKQRKAIYIGIPALIALFILAIYIGVKIIYSDEYYMQFELLVSEGHLDADFTQQEYFDFCDRIDGSALEKRFAHICFWID